MRLYVNINNFLAKLQNGLSWKTAFISLQSALDIATPGTDIWIAEGTYIPNKLYTPSGIPGGAGGITSINMFTFNLPNGVRLFGGFEGVEDNLCQRDIKKFKTILSGAKVMWHVITAGNDITQKGVDATLNGLYIILGNAFGPVGSNTIFAPFTYSHSYGAGLYVIFGSNVKVIKCILNENDASGSIPNLGGEGGAIYSNNSNVYVKNSEFFNNTANEQGGAIAFYYTRDTVAHKGIINRCVFTNNNSASLFGGAIVFEGTISNSGSFAKVSKSSFNSSYAQLGGAIAVDSIRVIINKCKFDKNLSAIAGGALSISNIVNTIAYGAIAQPVVTYVTTVKNSIFNDNETLGNSELRATLLGGITNGIDFPLGGGAIVCYINGFLDIDNCKFHHNIARNSFGGAILNGFSAANNPLGVPVIGFIAETRIIKSEFDGNLSINGSGGAIASLPSNAIFPTPIIIPKSAISLKVVDSTFINNKATFKGGAIFILNSTAELCRLCFKHNKAMKKNDVFEC
jgi:predicted outer membrane repeat protein